MRFFSTEIDASGWPLVFWIFDQNRAFTGFRISSFSRFVKVSQSFSMFFKVFQCFSRFFRVLTLNSDEGPPPRPFHSVILVKGGSYFSIFKGKIVFGDPPCLKLRPPLERESLPPKSPQMRGTPGSARVPG